MGATVIPKTIRAAGVLGGLVGLMVFSYWVFSLVSWLRGPMDDADKILLALSFGTVIPLAWMGVLLSLVFVGISLHAIADALGPCRGLSSGRLFIASGLATVWGLVNAITDGLNRADTMLLLSVGAIAALNLVFIVGYVRARRNPPEPPSPAEPPQPEKM